ncbi:MAG: methionine gamma-lyase family protein [Candidatus Pelethousia sp.]|nr:methionine gamma-lyase family protein [Candidatus Pelethousia sp.]
MQTSDDRFEPYKKLGVADTSIGFVLDAEAALAPVFGQVDAIEAANAARVLEAFQKEGVAQRHFAPTTGYGYDDIGRDTLDKVFAHALECADALVRPHFTSGTHAIFTALSGLLEPDDTLLSITGKPYDTLENAIGIAGDAPGSLRRMGVNYKQVELKADSIDLPNVLEALEDDSVRVVYVQRSRGYAWRNALLPKEMGPVFDAIHKKNTAAYIVVDNCYGEFTQPHEPSFYGADVIIGSLIKNPGGGIAPTGGYIGGTQKAIARIEGRLTVPGMGREVGSYAGSYVPFYQGLFLAPHTVAQSLKTAVLFARVFEEAGLISMPHSAAQRSDIVQSLRFKNADGLIAFCRSIQKAAPIDSFVTPEPWDMPGYQSQVIMAAGAFVQGSSIELSADGPLQAPYTAYVQGGLTYSHGRIGAMFAVDALTKIGEMCL